ncbi:hypothetical protein [Nodularia sphaerocarpa]|uniref:hypothetical protein n=1 Tax=Nodularia sphaerocarpa TaxID=137816 RepID=UPI001EFA9768|nr:hypothetical protein [Nodularia sphaerocarpa]MDB9374107.1 hypothetical protein [Nodularia sphaerocarpa CS-585]MDB9379905.1 hypothetical protein [Nodularia sphaerocarpa CS-585A2]ULP70870.1 hypothetical protein BDGGKGIB_00492 [Nodularia sphaerocarpa UHCC 0038]
MVPGIAFAKPEVIEQIIPEHLIGIMMVEEYAFLTHLLPKISLLACKPLIKAEHPQDMIKQ